MKSSQLRVEEVGQLLHAVEERIQSLMIDLQMLDEFKNVDAYRALEMQIRALNDQQRILSARWMTLTKGYTDNAEI